MSLSNFDPPRKSKSPTEQRNNSYEKKCNRCGGKIIMNYSVVKGKWWAANPDGTFHECVKLRPDLYGDKKWE